MVFHLVFRPSISRRSGAKTSFLRQVCHEVMISHDPSHRPGKPLVFRSFPPVITLCMVVHCPSERWSLLHDLRISHHSCGKRLGKEQRYDPAYQAVCATVVAYGCQCPPLRLRPLRATIVAWASSTVTLRCRSALLFFSVFRS